MINIQEHLDEHKAAKSVADNKPFVAQQVQQNPTNINDLNIVGFNQMQVNKEAESTPDNSLLNAGSNIQKATNNFVALDLPSKFVFYDFKDLHVRKLTIRDAAKLTRASTQANYKSFKEAIQGCIDRDVDVLTYGDFRYICYWLRVNSYPATPITIEWTSKYFNKNVSTVLKDDVITLVTDMTEESFKKWQEKGFDVPRMKFSDAFDKESPDKEESFIYQNAIYFKGDTWEEKFKNMDEYYAENGLDAVNIVKELDKEIEHGVEEYVTAIDTKFDVNDYKAKLEDKLKRLNATMVSMANKESPEYVMLELVSEQTEKDYSDLMKKLKKGEVVRAEPEKIFLELGPDELLSPLHR